MIGILTVIPLVNINFFSNAMAQEYGYEDSYNYDDNMYSKYPTEVNKYECRTGPFEGFFVSSVEFCKHIKFDKDDNRKDIRDNQTGPQGPPGPQGPLEPMESMEPKVHPAHKARQDLMVHKVHKVKEDLTELKALPEPLE